MPPMRALLVVLEVLLVAVITLRCDAGRAPDVAPDLPNGWCDLQYGTPTRTTGECICSQNCAGPRCRRESGVVWFTYSECPACQCVGSIHEHEKITSSDQHQEHESHGEEQLPTIEEEPREQNEPEEAFDLMDWIDDHFNHIFAGVVSIGVLYFCLMVVKGGIAIDEHKNTTPQPTSNKDTASKNK